MARLRDLGYKIGLLVKNEPSKENELLNVLLLSKKDLNRLIFGRLALSPLQIKKIAAIFSVTPESLVLDKNEDSYRDMVHCMSAFSSQKNCEEILDIIDSYIDIKESLAEDNVEN